LLQARRRKARGIALRAEHNHPQGMLIRRLDPGIAAWIEPPFQHIPFDDE
jgi:hypothetical protein